MSKADRNIRRAKNQKICELAQAYTGEDIEKCTLCPLFENCAWFSLEDGLEKQDESIRDAMSIMIGIIAELRELATGLAKQLKEK